MKPGEVINLEHSSIELRKAAALRGVHSGWIEFPEEHAPDIRVGIVAWAGNSRKAVPILKDDIDHVKQMTWREIKLNCKTSRSK